MGFNEREAAREELESALLEEKLNDTLLPRVPSAIREAEGAGLSYEEIVKIILSYLEEN